MGAGREVLEAPAAVGALEPAMGEELAAAGAGDADGEAGGVAPPRVPASVAGRGVPRVTSRAGAGAFEQGNAAAQRVGPQGVDAGRGGVDEGELAEPVGDGEGVVDVPEAGGSGESPVSRRREATMASASGRRRGRLARGSRRGDRGEGQPDLGDRSCGDEDGIAGRARGLAAGARGGDGVFAGRDVVQHECAAEGGGGVALVLVAYVEGEVGAGTGSPEASTTTPRMVPRSSVASAYAGCSTGSPGCQVTSVTGASATWRVGMVDWRRPRH